MKSNISNVPSSNQQVENVKAHPKSSPSQACDPAQERIKTNNNLDNNLDKIDKIYLDKINTRKTRNSILEIDKIYLDKILK